MDAPSEADLRSLAERYHMTYRSLAEWGPDGTWRQQKVGFQIDLHGAIDSMPTAPPAGDPQMHALQEALQRVAEWAFGGGGGDVTISIDSREGRVVHDASHAGWVAEIVGHVMHAGDVRRTIDRTEEQYLATVKQRLSQLGIAER